jgi:hypothetical protein
MPVLSDALKGVAKSLPTLAKHLPKLWPLLLESRNREKIMELSRELASSSPSRKLAAKMELTGALAETMAEQAQTDAERAQALDWQTRAARMRIRLDMPIDGVRAKREHRAQLREDLHLLHDEMSQSLRDEPGGGTGRLDRP